jgi:hypothetical protein
MMGRKARASTKTQSSARNKIGALQLEETLKARKLSRARRAVLFSTDRTQVNRQLDLTDDIPLPNFLRVAKMVVNPQGAY